MEGVEQFMATIYQKKNRGGSYGWQIQFQITPGEKIKTITLPSAFTQGDAEEVRLIVQKLSDSKRYGTGLNPKTLAIINQIAPFIRKKLEDAGLLESTKKKRITVAELWDRFYRHAEKSDRSPDTLNNITSAENWFLRHFGPDREIADITEIDAEEYKAWLLRQTLSPATVAGYIAKAKAVFNFGRKARIVKENPFEFVQKGSYRNPKRQFFVPAEWFPNILNACPSQEWRVLVALARFGGLRTPSEPFLLRWSDILWDRDRFYVTSPKTKNHAGHEGRFCPLFPEIRQELEDLLTVKGNPAGSDFVLEDMRSRCSKMNLRTTFGKIIMRAGYKPWEKLFNNLRATRDTELKRAGFTEDQRTAWLGHTESISQGHYQIVDALVTDADFDRAVCSLTIPTSATGANETEAFPAESGDFTN